MSHDADAYIYDADYHCEDCALRRFGRDEDGDITGEDSEGNEVGVVAPWDESPGLSDHDWDAGPYLFACGTCGTVMLAPEEDGSMIYKNPIESAAEWRERWWERRLEFATERVGELEIDLERAQGDVRTAIHVLNDGIALTEDHERGILTTREVKEAFRILADNVINLED